MPDLLKRTRGRYCWWNELSGSVEGCAESRWVGGNYGSSVCENQAHHQDRCLDCGEPLRLTGKHPVLGLMWACGNPKCDSMFKVLQ